MGWNTIQWEKKVEMPDISDGVKYNLNKPKDKIERRDDLVKNDHYYKHDGYIKDLIRPYECLKSPLSLLLYLLDNAAWSGKKDRHHTWDNWFMKKGLLVASMGRKKICKDLGISMDRLNSWKNILIANKLIKVKKEWRENVYVLGEFKDGEIIYYHEMV